MTKNWITYDKEELENIILKLSKEGNTPSKIGVILRDQYGVPKARELKTKVGKVLAKTEIKTPVPEDMFNLMKKAVELHKHMTKNKKDAKARHGLEYVESKIRRLGKYYVKTGKLPRGWKYSIDATKLIVK